MYNLEEVWNKQFGETITIAQDFSGEIVEKQHYKNTNSLYSWEIYNIENKECVIVSSSIIGQMPQTWENIFLINNNEFQFSKKDDGSFEVLLLRDVVKEEKIEVNHPILIEELKLKEDLFHDDEIQDKHNKNPRSLKRRAYKEPVLVEKPKKTKNPAKTKTTNVVETQTNDNLTISSDKIWESFYGNEIIVTDFAGTQITKHEFDLKTKNSWKTDLYSVNDEIMFIASVDNIHKRAGKDKFIIDDIEYSVIVRNGKYMIVHSNKTNNPSFPPNVLFKEIEQYFPSLLTNDDKLSQTTPNYISLSIKLSNFPTQELQKLRIMLQKLLKDIDVFQDIFIYNENNEFILEYENNCSVIIFFKSNNIISDDMEIFNLSLFTKNILSITINNIKTAYNLSNLTSFTMFLVNHNHNYKYISWFTKYDIEFFENNLPYVVNNDELIIDKFFYELFINFKGYVSSFVMIKNQMNDVFYLCNIELNNVSNSINSQMIKNKSNSLE